ncbi:MAG: tail completion protein gp17 [Lacipirellulaceae bacterium]
MRADFTASLRAHLVASVTVGPLVGTRVYPDALPQQCGLPAIRYTTLSDRAASVLRGVSTLRQGRVQLDCYAATRAESDHLAALVEAELQLCPARLGEGVHSVDLEDLEVENSYARVDPPRDASDEPRYRRVLDLEVAYQAESPAS